MSNVDDVNLPDAIESVFKNKEEYLLWFTEALGVIRGKNKKQNPLSSLIPEYIEIDFNGTVKAPRLYYPKNRPDTIIIQLPIAKNSPRAKGAVREHKLPVYSSVKGRIEVAIADEFAIRFKLLADNGKDAPTSRKSGKKKVAKKTTKKKVTKRNK